MFEKLNFFKYLSYKSYKHYDCNSLQQDAAAILHNLVTNELSHLDIQGCHYQPDEAIEELGIDEELVMQLLDDYVAQIIKAIVQFEEYLHKLQSSQDLQEKLDYTNFRELAHKNLGVARNLRIKDAEILLYELMKKDDLEYLLLCLEALKMCAIQLSSQCAYDTLKLIEVKNSLLSDYSPRSE